MAFVDFFVFQSLFHEGLPETRQNHFRVASGREGRTCGKCDHCYFDDESDTWRCSCLQTGDLDDLPVGVVDCNTLCDLYRNAEDEEEDADDEEE